MSKLRNFLFASALFVAVPVTASAQVFVGSWILGNGPIWNTGTAPTYTGQDAAAFIFGGLPTDYVISTIDNNPLNIDNMAWYDQYGIGVSKKSESFYQNNAGPGYDTFGDASAYICDNSQIGAGPYCNPPEGDPTYTNYAFKVSAVPEPTSMALIATGLIGIVGVARRRTRKA